MEELIDSVICPRCYNNFEWRILNPDKKPKIWFDKLELPKNVKDIVSLQDRFSLALQCPFCNCRFPIEKMKENV